MAKAATRKPARPRLKVFQAQFGFYDTVVAAASQAAALRAWGTHQNLFTSGQAKITDDPSAIEAALAHPDTPLKRAVGSKDVFALEAARLPEIPDARKGKSAKAATKSRPVAESKPLASRAELDVAEKALRHLDEARKVEEVELRRMQDELDAKINAAQTDYAHARKAITRAVHEARQAYRKAGGEG